MNMNSIDELYASFQSGKLSSLELGQRILALAIPSDGNLTPDLDRLQRTGYPEVVYGQGKSTESIQKVTQRLLETTPEVLITRILPEQVRVLAEVFSLTRWNHLARTLRVSNLNAPMDPDQVRSVKRVGVVTAGTTDQPVAEEARETLAWMGIESVLIQDVGVAGPYRLLSRVPDLRKCSVVICVAGMEAALPSALAGHVACPVIAVPTSVGYGANLGGIAALLSMLNSCAANVTVVNIDAGFKGGYVAGLIASGDQKSA
ncbi:MAG: nickel pincer cofactor biosynthesis protein LarB [Pirellula sp.]